MIKKTYQSITISQVLISILIAITVFFTYNLNEAKQLQLRQEEMRERLSLERTRRLQEPVTNWFTVDFIVVPDFSISEDPIIQVSRTIHKPFTASWSVELEMVTSKGNVFVCRAAGENHYQTDDKLPNPLKISWWMYEKNFNFKRECGPNIVHGAKYRLVTRWTIIPDEPEYDSKKIKVYSNIFTILKDE